MPVTAAAIRRRDTADQRQAGQIAIVYLLCGALGAFTRNLVEELETQRAAAIDQATQMATANDLLVSFLCSAEGGWINGQLLQSNGGMA